jgi:hypothetical protein
MQAIPRRTLLQFGAAAALDAPQARAQITASNRVVLFGDGLSLSPARLIAKIAAQDQFSRDTYLAGSAVQELEKRMAALLNKERAIFLPTGTLANHLACTPPYSIPSTFRYISTSTRLLVRFSWDRLP